MQFDQLRRRDFIALLGGAAGWPLAARAQQPSSLVGVLHSGSFTTFAPLINAFRRGLQEGGFIEGQNVTLEYRWAENQYDRLPVMAAELVHLQPAVIYAGGSVRAAKAATSTIPIVSVSWWPRWLKGKASQSRRVTQLNYRPTTKSHKAKVCDATRASR